MLYGRAARLDGWVVVTLHVMKRPPYTDMLIATHWLDHHGSMWAWEELDHLVGSDPRAAWEIIRLMVAYAPDYGSLAAVAAGPVEDLLSRDESFEPMRAEAEANPRFRLCLAAAYGLPADLQVYAEKETAARQLPPPTVYPDATGSRTALIVAWFHQSDTHWAGAFLNERIRTDGDAAWPVLRVLLRLSDDLVELQKDVFLFAFEPFLKRHLATHRAELTELARSHTALRERLFHYRNPPVENHELWAAFLVDLGSG